MWPILGLLILLLMPAATDAATYYVDPSSGNDVNAGTVCADPIAGYSKAGFLAALTAGDIVLQKAGTTYTGQLAPSTSGSSGNPIIFGVYVSCASPNRVTDGSSRAIIDGNNAVSPVISIASRTDITVDGLDVQGTSDAGGTACHIRAQQSTRITVRYSTARIGTGTGRCGFTDNRGDTNVWEFLNASGMLQNGFLIYGPAASSAYNITVRDSTFDSNNTIGAVNAGIKWGPDDSVAKIVGMVLTRNSCSNNGVSSGSGIRATGNVLGATISYNTCSGNKYGLYFDGTSATEGTGDNWQGTVISYNTANTNSEFGILSSRVDNVIIEHNTTNYNGADTATDYGRGIEVVGTTTNHARNVLLRHNTAIGNYNYITNGTEGVGIAFDNYTDDSTMYGNYAEGNEGTGFTTYICTRCIVTGNVSVRNGVNFRGGGAASSAKNELGIGSGSVTVIVANNTIISSCGQQTRYGIAESNASTSTGVVVRNNYIQGACIGAISVRSSTTRDHNGFWQNTATNVNAADDTALSDGTGDVTSYPLLLSDYRPSGSSPLRLAGGVRDTCFDYRGRPCWDPPDIGAYQSTSGDPAATRAVRN